MEANDELMLTWSNHRPTLVNEVAQLRHQGCYSDVTLACAGRMYLAHKFVLAMCSDYFRSIFGSSSVSGNSSNLVIVLKDVACQDVEQLLDFMYTGVVAVDRACLPSLIKTAEHLQIKGLAFPDQLPAEQQTVGGHHNHHHHHHHHQIVHGSPVVDDGDRYIAQQQQHCHESVTTDDRSSLGESDSIYDDDSAPVVATNVKRSSVSDISSHLDVRLKRDINDPKRLSVASKDLNSPPCKRKRGHDYGQQQSNTSSQAHFSRKATSPILHHLFASSSSTSMVPTTNMQSSNQSCSSLYGSAHQQTRTPNSSNSSFVDIHSSLSKQSQEAHASSYVASPRRGVSISPHNQQQLVASSSEVLATAYASPVAGPVATTTKSESCSPPTAAHSPSLAAAGAVLPRPEDVEIKQELPDIGDMCDGSSARLSLITSNKESGNMKLEPSADGEDPDHSRETLPGEDCWSGVVAASSLLADDDTGSDTEVQGVMCWAESQEKRYRCEWCGKNFRLSVHLKDHLRTHTGEKPYHCSICFKNFTQRSNLRTHLFKIHNVQLEYVKTRRGRTTSVVMPFTDTVSYSQPSSVAATTPGLLTQRVVPAINTDLLYSPPASGDPPDTINVADIGIVENNTRPPPATAPNAEATTFVEHNKKQKTLSDDCERSPVMPYLSKETVSMLCSSEGHFLEVANQSISSAVAGVASDNAVAVGVGHIRNGASNIHSNSNNTSNSSNCQQQVYTGSESRCILSGSPLVPATGAATPLTPVPRTPDPLLKTLLLKGGQQPNSVVTIDASSSDKSKAPLLFTTNSPTSTNSNMAINSLSGATLTSTKLVNAINNTQAIAVSGPDDTTISATFAFHPTAQNSNFGVAGKDLTKSVILMDVANKGLSTTLLKLPASMMKSDGKLTLPQDNDGFTVIEASGIVPQTPGQGSGNEAVASTQLRQEEDNMELLLQAIDMKETTPVSAGMKGATAGTQVLPVAVSQVPVSLQSTHQTTLNLQLPAKFNNSPIRGNVVHKSQQSISPQSPMVPTINSPIFPSFSLQRSANPSSFSSTPTLIPSSMLSPIPSPLTASSGGAISLPIYSLSSSNTSNQLLSTSHIITVPTTSNAGLASAVFLSPTGSSISAAAPVALQQQSSSPLLTLAAPAVGNISSSNVNIGGGDLMNRRIAQVLRESQALQRSGTAKTLNILSDNTNDCQENSGNNTVVAAPNTAVTVNIAGQEMTVHNNRSHESPLQKSNRIGEQIVGPARLVPNTVATNIPVVEAPPPPPQNGSSVARPLSNPSTLQLLSPTIAKAAAIVAPLGPSSPSVSYQQLQLSSQQHQQQRVVHQSLPLLQPKQQQHQQQTLVQIQHQQTTAAVSLQQQQHHTPLPQFHHHKHYRKQQHAATATVDRPPGPTIATQLPRQNQQQYKQQKITTTPNVLKGETFPGTALSLVKNDSITGSGSSNSNNNSNSSSSIGASVATVGTGTVGDTVVGDCSNGNT